MTAAVKVFLVCCLLQGSFCQRWASFLPRPVQGLSGSCVRVSCSFTIPSGWDSSLNPSCRAIWKRGGTEMFDTSKTGGRADLTGNLLQKDCTTTFNNLQSTDSGTYRFRLQCNNDLKYNFENAETQITVQDSLPSPSITPSSLEVEEGAPVRLKCSAEAPCPILPPALTWTPTIGDVEENPETEFMTSAISFTASDLHNGQRLVCAALYNRSAQSASSPFETDTSLTLQVLYPPKNTSVSYPSPVREGTSVTLTCSANANPAVNSYTWYKVDGDQETEVGSNNQALTTVSEADEQFYCKVANKYGTQNSSVTEMDVQFPPKEVTVVVQPEGPILEGSSVTLLCSSRANPPVAVSNYTWFKDDEEDESGESWVINHVDPSYSGTYHCAARNELGEETSASIQLDVQYPPKNTSLSVDPSGPVPDGSSVTLTCTTIADPAAVNFSWFKAAGREKEMVGSEQDFTFNVTKLSKDLYYCKAQNVHGYQYSEPANIDVTFAPEILTSSSCVTISSQIRCTCNSQGNPLPSLVWELAGKKVQHSAAISIMEVPLGSMEMRSIITLNHRDDCMSSVVCLSLNSLGSDSFEFNVKYSETEPPGVDAPSLLGGFALGAVGMLLVCIPLLLFFYRKSKGKGLVDASDVVVTNGTNSSMVHVIYDNKAVLKDEGEDDSLHYANLNFVKRQVESEGKLGDGEIRGPDSRTTEYAEIRLKTRLVS
ncbi:myelin-associated glycoprotein-like [Centropristis striata]|uniref:myelin-associated glycoprotein-like n=1 Tax=Centropristis striata TaxID=184440 RepID=UPI0027DF2C79|nr:myelin-associated glycoprotein-like [Centropristis striata]